MLTWIAWQKNRKGRELQEHLRPIDNVFTAVWNQEKKTFQLWFKMWTIINNKKFKFDRYSSISIDPLKMCIQYSSCANTPRQLFLAGKWLLLWQRLTRRLYFSYQSSSFLCCPYDIESSEFNIRNWVELVLRCYKWWQSTKMHQRSIWKDLEVNQSWTHCSWRGINSSTLMDFLEILFYILEIWFLVYLFFLIKIVFIILSRIDEKQMIRNKFIFFPEASTIFSSVLSWMKKLLPPYTYDFKLGQ